ncbi:hypothetical protein [Micromonospora phytophila]|uniref:hypothetical protein n=1 Tax=Micromonospora phytophila TaxID=709888 RepID=UPI0027E220EF|nr:hypothetical protein [Micromonospora phytophila]
MPGQVDALARTSHWPGLVSTSSRKRRVKVRTLSSAWAAKSASVDNGLMHAIGEGHLVTLDIPATIPLF